MNIASFPFLHFFEFEHAHLLVVINLDEKLIQDICALTVCVLNSNMSNKELTKVSSVLITCLFTWKAHCILMYETSYAHKVWIIESFHAENKQED